jgi:hypothetical protein
VLAGVALSLVAALTVVSIGHQTGKPRAPRAVAAAASVRTAAHVLVDVPGIQVARPFETGYTVSDFNGAMTQFSDTMGIQWGPIQSATLNMRLRTGQVVPILFHVVLSVQGPPYIELVQGVTGSADNPFKASPTDSPVHLGFIVRNLAAASDALAAAGFPRITTVAVPGQDASIFAYHQGPGNIIIELFPAAFAPPGVCDTPNSPFCPPDS